MSDQGTAAPPDFLTGSGGVSPIPAPGSVGSVDHLHLFAAPLLVFDLLGMEETNRALAASLLTESQTSSGQERSNVGGWHSTPDLAHRSQACYRTLMQAIVECTAGSVVRFASEAGLGEPPPYRYGLNAWAMVMRSGDYSIVHDHGDSHFSSAYYVDAGDADTDTHPQSGLLAFVDPRSGGRPIANLDLFPSTFTVRPRTGMLVLFPGWLQHYVHAYRGTRPRISISCNVFMDPAVRPGGPSIKP